MKTHQVPSDTPVSSQRVSELLAFLGTDGKQIFLAAWMQKVAEDELLCYDITSISSYSELNEYIRYGHDHSGVRQEGSIQ